MALVSISETCAISRGQAEWNLNVWKFSEDGQREYEVVCLFYGSVKDEIPVRINSPCLTSEVFGDEGRCDCKEQLNNAFRIMEERGTGLIIYPLHEEGRGHGITNKVNSYYLMNRYRISTKEAFVRLGLTPDIRRYDYLKDIFSHFGLKTVSLLTNNQEKIDAITQTGVSVIRVPLFVEDPRLKQYLESKIRELNHLL